MSILQWVILTAAGCWLTVVAAADAADSTNVKPVIAPKPAEAAEKPAPQTPSPAQQVTNRFQRNSPAIGEPLPDLTAYTSDGKPFPLSRLKGNYTVLVFGCLT